MDVKKELEGLLLEQWCNAYQDKRLLPLLVFTDLRKKRFGSMGGGTCLGRMLLCTILWYVTLLINMIYGDDDDRS
jgi:hypothetical protein